MALTICELFDKKMNGSQSEDWITVERPDEVIDRINTMDCFDEVRSHSKNDVACLDTLLITEKNVDFLLFL